MRHNPAVPSDGRSVPGEDWGAPGDDPDGQTEAAEAWKQPPSDHLTIIIISLSHCPAPCCYDIREKLLLCFAWLSLSWSSCSIAWYYILQTDIALSPDLYIYLPLSVFFYLSSFEIQYCHRQTCLEFWKTGRGQEVTKFKHEVPLTCQEVFCCVGKGLDNVLCGSGRSLSHTKD